jgi:aspartate/methionine/tyrosine aminotransferase
MFGDTSTNYIRISYLQPLPLIRDAIGRIADFTTKARATA